MKCDEVQKILAAASEDPGMPLPQEVHGHMAGCGDCRRMRAELAEVWRVLEMWPDVESSPDFRPRFWQRLEQREHAGVWGRLKGSWISILPPQRILAAVALVLLTGVGAMFVFQRPGNIPPETSVPAGSAAMNFEDEQLLQSLSQLTLETAAHSLEVYDLWRVSSDDMLPSATPESDNPQIEKPINKSSRITHESIG